MGFMDQYDVGIYGLWYGRNYGSMATYYALKQVVNDLGYSVVMIENPLRRESFDLKGLPSSHPVRFAQSQYKMTGLYKLEEMGALNTVCKGFLLGSDQMWNYNLSRAYGQSYFLDFAASDRVKVAYGTSFGRYPYNGPDSEKTLISANLKRFDAVSVRDDFSKRIAEEDFGVHATQVLDPVFLCKESVYEDLIAGVSEVLEEHFIFVYVLDPTRDFGIAIEKALDVSGKRAIIVFDEPADTTKSLNLLGIDDDRVLTLNHPALPQWLHCFKNADFVLTDSFHGACFSIIFERDFLVFRNEGRGGGRFDSLLSSLGLQHRAAQSHYGLGHMFLEMYETSHIDYKAVKRELTILATDSYRWLKEALEPINSVKIVSPVKLPAEAEGAKLPPDIQRCKMVASLLRDYGIKHVVCSSGARDVSLVRLFEENDCFTTHNVLDERSAAYYALGLALQLDGPVAITCTSGTAVSNYLPGITEAFHMQVPIVVISGDRYPYFLGQMEAQKIDHIGALASVVKASADLSIGWDGMIQWETRRKICEALLEMNHHGKGPVHINVPMNYLENRYPTDAGAFYLPNYRNIRRIELDSPSLEFDLALSKLRESRRILIISGQSAPLREEDRHAFDAFCEKFNCCVVTDHLSNLHGKYVINPFNLLRSIGNKYFSDNLKPDLVLYIGGKRVLNCPLQAKMRSVSRDFEFWRIDPDGKVADLYRTLTHVFEMSPGHFFNYFAQRAEPGDSNDGTYFGIWNEKASEYPQFDYRKSKNFSSFFTIGSVFARLPKNSMIHLGVGTSFNRAHYYDLDPSVLVHCNMGTNGIDGSASTFMGQSLMSGRPSYLLIGDLSFFYDMNSLWNKPYAGNVRILLNNDHGAGFLRHFGASGITHEHDATAKGWVESLGFRYISAYSKEEFEAKVEEFTSDEDVPMFFEAFIQ